MARMARLVAAGYPHHITQRGNRRMPVFFTESDYIYYLKLLSEWSIRHRLEVLAYCLMPNHVHVIGVPRESRSLHLAFRETHRRYSSFVNLREGWRGYLWQGRFSSFAMDMEHTYNAIRYVEDNPVRAGLVSIPTDWPWSSAYYRLCAKSSADFPHLCSEHMDTTFDPLPAELLQKHIQTGRPLGNESFIDHLEEVYQRSLRPQKRGRKPKEPG